MLSIDTILVPVDYSEPSKRALDAGKALARKLDSMLLVAHIVPTERDAEFAVALGGPVPAGRGIGDAEARLAEFISSGGPLPRQHRRIVRSGRIEEALDLIIEEEHVELVVMGTHARRHVARWLMGSTTEREVRACRVPILTVSARSQAEHWTLDPERVLYATDLSSVDERANHVVVALAQHFSAELDVVHVIESKSSIGPHTVVGTPAEDDQARTALRNMIDDRLPRSVRRNPEVRVEILDGDVAERILDYAKDREADLIVLNATQRSGLDRLLLGAVAETVVRHSPVPVLSIPPDDANVIAAPLLGRGPVML